MRLINLEDITNLIKESVIKINYKKFNITVTSNMTRARQRASMSKLAFDRVSHCFRNYAMR